MTDLILEDAGWPHGFGFCHCGCGEKTNIARKTMARAGYVKGQPRRYLHGHRARLGWRTTEEDHGHPTPCRVWQGYRNPAGYGQVTIDRRSRAAHRVAWERANGPIPEGMHLDHLCRNTSCVNPAHLEPVTGSENTRRGDSAKLTKADVAAIRASGRKGRDLAREYGVCEASISQIKNRKRWTTDMEVTA